MKKRFASVVVLLLVALAAIGSEPTGYYNSAYNKGSEQLRQALYNIIKDHTVVTYGYLYTVYQTSDVLNGQIWDIYSTCSFDPGASQRCGDYVSVCDCYNREHTVPQSWFNEASPMKSDAFHIYPTDGKVNGQRSNYPYGECANGTNLGGHALGRLGSSTFPGYNGTVFEPDDEYKGDLARTYFYMATRYADQCNSWGHGVFSSANSGLSDYAVALFMKWHREDPVSQKEIIRNDAIYAHQDNRNPFIDHPELAEYIWGNMTSGTWNPTQVDLDFVARPQVTVAPNPASEQIAFSESASVVMMTLEGNVVAQAENATSISVSTLPEGMYLIRLTTDQDGNITYQKIVVKH